MLRYADRIPQNSLMRSMAIRANRVSTRAMGNQTCRK